MRFFADSGTWHKGLHWYSQQFPPNKTTLIESHGGSYTAYPSEPNIPERIFSVLPHARFIYIVRNPIDRMISRYIHLYSNGIENRPIDTALLDWNDPEYIPQSQYYMQLQRYFKYYETNRFLLVLHDDFLNKRRESLRVIFDFLQVNPDYWSAEFDIIRHPSRAKRRNNALGLFIQNKIANQIFNKLKDSQRYWFKKIFYTPISTKIIRPQITDETRVKLHSLFQNDIACLETFMGRNLGHWQL